MPSFVLVHVKPKEITPHRLSRQLFFCTFANLNLVKLDSPKIPYLKLSIVRHTNKLGNNILISTENWNKTNRFNKLLMNQVK